MNQRVDLRGSYDLHIHTAPCIYPRYLDDVEAALQARDVGMRGIMLKSHHESTTSRAYHTARAVPGIKVYGGIVLNHFVGGISPASVQVALEQGAKQIWMPTVDSAEHRRIFGSLRTYGLKSMGTKGNVAELAAITILSESGQLTEETKQIIDLVKDFGACIGTTHLSYDEILAVVQY